MDRVRVRVGFWGADIESPSRQLGDLARIWGSAVSSSSVAWGEASASKSFDAFLTLLKLTMFYVDTLYY